MQLNACTVSASHAAFREIADSTFRESRDKFFASLAVTPTSSTPPYANPTRGSASAKAGRIRQADEFEHDEGIAYIDLERLRDQFAQFARIGAVGDDQEFAVDKPIGARRIGWARQRNGIGALFDFVDVHGAGSSVTPWATCCAWAPVAVNKERDPSCLRREC